MRHEFVRWVTNEFSIMNILSSSSKSHWPSEQGACNPRNSSFDSMRFPIGSAKGAILHPFSILIAPLRMWLQWLAILLQKNPGILLPLSLQSAPFKAVPRDVGFWLDWRRTGLPCGSSQVELWKRGTGARTVIHVLDEDLLREKNFDHSLALMLYLPR